VIMFKKCTIFYEKKEHCCGTTGDAAQSLTKLHAVMNLASTCWARSGNVMCFL
jgi:hypothetical protein